jgi:thiol-disulfide isomerase/thioredoxin
MTRLLLLLVLGALSAEASLVRDVRAAAGRRDFAGGEKLIAEYRAARGATSELILAISWLGRGALDAKDFASARRYAAETRDLALEALKKRRLDDDKDLPTALGAAIEVQGQALAGEGRLSEALFFLNGELERWRGTSMRARIQKNIHVLSLEGKPAPPLGADETLGDSLLSPDRLRGRVVLLFFWAHWCPDCKHAAPVLARLAERFGGRGLVVIGPTKRYGFTARGEEASPEAELAYIDRIRREQYGGVSGMAVPVSEETFAAYGSSTTPTIVLIDREGIVRLYHPGEMSYEELEPKIRPLL